MEIEVRAVKHTRAMREVSSWEWK